MIQLWIYVLVWSISGPEFILQQAVPCAVIKAITATRVLLYGSEMSGLNPSEGENVTVDILDARKHKPGTFAETGFTLIELDKVLIWLV